MPTSKDLSLYVVKFGGATIADSYKIKRASSLLKKLVERGRKVIVVVSAMGKTTDELIKLASSSSWGLPQREQLDEILSMGERLSSRVMASSLSSLGVKTFLMDPMRDDWPIITDDAFGDANPKMDVCQERIRKSVEPLLEKGYVLIFPGFVGKTEDGRITTLGRGGSDTTAFLLASSLAANLVILVTSVEGIMTADPKVIKKARRLDRLTVAELALLADSGAKFIHRKSLKYLSGDVKVKVVSYLIEDLETSGGTIIEGEYPPLTVDVHHRTVTAVVIAGRISASLTDILAPLLALLRVHSLKLIGLLTDGLNITMYVSGELPKSFLEELHSLYVESGNALGISVRSGLSSIIIKGSGLSERPGLLSQVSAPLKTHGINIHGVITLGSNFILFLERKHLDTALNLVGGALSSG